MNFSNKHIISIKSSKLMFIGLAFGLLASCAPGAPLVYYSNQCAACHHPYLVSIGPSLDSIAEKYNGDGQNLYDFLNGRSGPIVEPSRFTIMAPMMRQVAKWNHGEKQKMADFIAGFQK